MGIHDGHRKRLKEKFIEHGLDPFSDVNVLEFLLFFSVPRKDTNELAHKLLERFGSLHAVFNASFYELNEVEGVNYSSAVLISLISQLSRRIEISKTSNIKTIKDTADAAEYFISRFKNQQYESLLMMCLDAKRNIISCKEMATGSTVSTSIDVRKLAEHAVSSRAAYVIISHNHPGGTIYPSSEDQSLTHNLHTALRYVDVFMEDHIIVAGDNYTSFRKLGAMRYL